MLAGPPQPGLQSGVPVGSPYHNNIAAIAAGSADVETTDVFSRISLEHLTSDRQKRFQRCIGTTSPASPFTLATDSFVAAANGSWLLQNMCRCADRHIFAHRLSKQCRARTTATTRGALQDCHLDRCDSDSFH